MGGDIIRSRYFAVLCFACVPASLQAQAVLQGGVAQKVENAYRQMAIMTDEFPRPQIKRAWNDGWRVQHVVRNQSKWTVVFARSTLKQRFIFNPTGDQVNELLEDGYSITTGDYFNERSARKLVLFLTKISRRPVSQHYFFGTSGCDDTKVESWRKRVIDSKSFQIAQERCHDTPGARHEAFLGFSFAKGDGTVAKQTFAVRSDSSDYLENQKAAGYYPQSITYSRLRRKYLIVMTYNPSVKWERQIYYNQNMVAAAAANEKRFIFALTE